MRSVANHAEGLVQEFPIPFIVHHIEFEGQILSIHIRSICRILRLLDTSGSLKKKTFLFFFHQGSGPLEFGTEAPLIPRSLNESLMTFPAVWSVRLMPFSSKRYLGRCHIEQKATKYIHIPIKKENHIYIYITSIPAASMMVLW